MTNWSGGKSLSLAQMTYENWLKAINQEHPVDLGDWQDSLSDSELNINQDDYESDEEYIEAADEAYAEYIIARFNDWVWKYKSWKFPLTIYRTICLKTYDELKRDELGTDWSDEEDSAHCYNKHLASGDNYYTLEAKVGKADIDWVVMMANNLNPSFGDDEQEVNLLPGRKVKVVKVEGPDSDEKGFVGNVGHHITAKLLTVLARLTT